MHQRWCQYWSQYWVPARTTSTKYSVMTIPFFHRNPLYTMKEHTNGQKKLPTDCMLYERLHHLDLKRNWANGLLLLTRDHTSWTLCLTQSNGQGRRSKGKKRKIGWKGFQERIIAHGGNIEQDQCIALQCSLQNNQDKTRQTHRYSKNSSNGGDQTNVKEDWMKRMLIGDNSWGGKIGQVIWKQ